MISSDKTIQAYFVLVGAGLWEKEARLSHLGEIDYGEVYRLAEEQSVVGLVAAGIEHVVDIKIPQEVALLFVGDTLRLEQQNIAMNAFVARLIEKLRKEDTYALLVKGQGIAQCYERPLWRTCGDVDLLLSEENYKKARITLSSYASSIDDENEYNRHIALTIKQWTVELHGTLRSGLWKRLDREIDRVQYNVFFEGNVRSWINGHTQVFLPHPDDDAIFVFSHILQHFYKEGIGLRQICDWCRLLWTYKDSFNQELLVTRLHKMGVFSEWLAFAALAVDYLGMPKEAMPLYSPEGRWSNKGDKVMRFVLETGNFGHNRDYSYYKQYPYVVYKAISLWRHLCDGMRYFFIFPNSSVKVLSRSLVVGFSVALKGKKHE